MRTEPGLAIAEEHSRGQRGACGRRLRLWEPSEGKVIPGSSQNARTPVRHGRTRSVGFEWTDAWEREWTDPPRWVGIRNLAAAEALPTVLPKKPIEGDCNFPRSRPPFSPGTENPPNFLKSKICRISSNWRIFPHGSPFSAFRPFLPQDAADHHV